MPRNDFLKSVWRRRDGAVAVQFALLALPLAVMAFGVYDINHATSRKQQVQDALDAATLLAARSTAVTDTDLQKVGEAALKAQLNGMTDATLVFDKFSSDSASGGVLSSAKITIKPVIANLWQSGDMAVNVSSAVVRSVNKLEVVMVLDNTGSMSSSNKLTNLKTAAATLIDTLSKAAASSTDPDSVKIGIVPFSTTVRLASDSATLTTYQNAAWMDSAGKEKASKALFNTTSAVNRFTLFSKLGKSWAGCVESRAMPYDVQDTAPSSTTADTLITPYFWPDEFDPPVYMTDSKGKTIKDSKGNKVIDTRYNGDFGTAENNYQTDANYSQTNFMVPQGDATKYTKKLSSSVAGPNYNCTMAPISRLSTNWSALKTSVNSMVAVGETHIPIGLMWGWHVLSPNAPFSDGVPYGTPKTTKIIILMTDGENTWNQSNITNSNGSDYDGYGYLWEKRLGAIDPGKNFSAYQTNLTAALDGRTTALCNNIKAKGIIIYSVGDMVSDDSKKLLTACATTADDYYDVTSSAAITDAFSAIAGSISNLRISQ